jgi:hypothetical protein
MKTAALPAIAPLNGMTQIKILCHNAKAMALLKYVGKTVGNFTPQKQLPYLPWPP